MTEYHDPDPTPALGATRSRVLALLQDAGTAMSVEDVSARIGLHRNTARFHLDGLEDTGLVVRTTEDRGRPGRPRAMFEAAAGSPEAGRRSYRLLADILTSYLADRLPQPSESAEEAGVAWGRYLADEPPPFRRVEADTAVESLVDRLREVGFDSHPERDGDSIALNISHCPFLEVAADHRDVVCSMHLGLMKGVLEQMRASVVAESLEPLVQPSLCIAHLRRVAETA